MTGQELSYMVDGIGTDLKVLDTRAACRWHRKQALAAKHRTSPWFVARRTSFAVALLARIVRPVQPSVKARPA